jgi:orotate phosphoribosyltransferase
MNRVELAKEIYKVSYLTGEFLLRSGKTSNEYFDKYQFETYPHILSSIAEQFEAILPVDFDYFAALEMGGIPIGTALSLQCGKPVLFIRKRPKEYGTRKFAEGPDITGKKLLIVEDVVTTGGQILLSVNELRNAGALITDTICVIDRESGGIETLKHVNLNLHALFTMSEIKSFQ